MLAKPEIIYFLRYYSNLAPLALVHILLQYRFYFAKLFKRVQ
jgi:hypothetical protein